MYPFFFPMSQKFWPALEFGAAWIKFKIGISIPMNFVGLFWGNFINVCSIAIKSGSTWHGK